MLGIILGVLTIGLGMKAFSADGLPLSRSRNLTGATARVIGVFCVLLGLLMIADGVFGTLRILKLIGRG
jgi:uncharacterized membrane protein YidH (DUF202 family)